jgi:hypothetical protein
MFSVYVVIENGEPYENAYTSFASTVTAVKEKHTEEIAEQIRVSNSYLSVRKLMCYKIY